ncbi:putative SEC14-like protein 6 [Folsomia candida]|uniref:Phosphatidylinositol/phosphatidylcholine transfer protein SFH3 n=1 Tax=Folsomia candida TaxID=158441 RepID=A0A226CZQ3_FOLCA|nr:putative SEC14-like protein 6 [Folsomia candida]OXA38028.1 Phosphatidylinositol/phosphatidylcholine transfer protein SFH3 [Folsomia candida]
MSLPTEEEKDAIKVFRENLKDALTEDELGDDFFLLRWLRARDLDLVKSEQMLRTAISWRIENNVDDVLNKKIDPFFPENYPRWIGGVDKEGRPIYCAGVGQWDLRTVVRKGESKGFQEYTTHGFESMMQLLKEANDVRESPAEDTTAPPITQIIAIFDFAGFAWSQLLNYKAVGELLQLGSIYEAYYPEILHSCYFINCPSLISKIFILLKPILAPKTMAKIKCFGNSKDEWRAEFLTVIDEDQLVPEIGGTRGLICNNSM